MNKKIIIIFILISLVASGCSKNASSKMDKTSIDQSKYDTKNFSSIHCTRSTQTEDDAEVEITYQVYYNEKKEIEVLKSLEEVSSENKETLAKYKEAYQSIYSVYEDLAYYDHETREEEGKVVSITYINYGKIDIEKLMQIEGYEDNVKITNGKIKLEDWKDFAKKYGTQCSSNS